jgi:hypothetical protein
MYQLKSKLLDSSKTKMEMLQHLLRFVSLSKFIQKVMPIWVLLILMANVSCTRNQHELILVIAVEGLSSQKLVCTAESPENSGISQLCKESIRFTHAFTPSTLSAPTFASFLTGTYPIQHGLHNNSQDLTTALPTIPQELLKQNYSTLMFSGSPPILSKTGLGRGFEVFNDHLSEYPYFQRNLRDSWSIAEDEIFSWRGLKKKTFLILHTAELMSATAVNPSIQTASNVDYNEIALQNLDRSLSEIFQSLKNRGAWLHSTVILMGLNGEMDRDFLSYPAPLNLKTSNTQVALFIKPPTKERDLDLNWSVDTNVSLVDVGRTLFDLFHLSYSPPDDENEILHPRSLMGHLGFNSNKIRTDQPILIESDWGRWRIRNKSNTRYALLSADYLYIHDSKPKLYNILTDKMQVNNIYFPQAKIMTSFLRIADQLDLPPWNNYPSSWTASLAIPLRDWIKSTTSQHSEFYNSHHTIAPYNLQNWESFLKDESKDPSLPHDPCIEAYDKKDSYAKSCSDLKTKLLIQTLANQGQGSSESEHNRILFDVLYRRHLAARQIYLFNLGVGDIWDHPLNLNLQPQPIDYLMARPENRQTRLRIQSDVLQKFELHESNSLSE